MSKASGMDPWRAKQGRPALSKEQKGHFATLTQDPQDAPGICEQFSASLPARSAHTSGKALQHPFLHLENQVQGTDWLVLYNFMTLLFI